MMEEPLILQDEEMENGSAQHHLSNESQSYNEQSEHSNQQPEIDEEKDPELYELAPEVTDIGTQSWGRALDGSFPVGRRPRKKGSRKGSKSLLSSQEKEESSSTEMERKGFTYDLIRHRECFVKTNDQPLPDAQVKNMAAQVIDDLDSSPRNPESTVCLLL
jgi:hypothetical protein